MSILLGMEIIPHLIHIKGKPIRGSTAYPLDLPENNRVRVMVRVRASHAAESFQRERYIYLYHCIASPVMDVGRDMSCVKVRALSDASLGGILPAYCNSML